MKMNNQALSSEVEDSNASQRIVGPSVEGSREFTQDKTWRQPSCKKIRLKIKWVYITALLGLHLLSMTQFKLHVESVSWFAHAPFSPCESKLV